jgi:pimeloyl-ACP methyl ester carboxylesterase
MADSWQTSLDRVHALQRLDDDSIVPECGTQALLHDGPTAEAVLLLHGFTNAPPQWREIAAAYHARGFNVLVPRVPYHGLKDPLNRALSDLTPELLAVFTDEAVDAAAGLGGRLRVAGLSLGGLLAAYAAKHRDEVAEAYLIAPFFQPKAVPEWVDAPFDAAMRALPDLYSWWNPAAKEAAVRGTWAYPKFSLKAIASMISLRRDLERGPARRANRAERVLLVINEHDIAIRNDVAQQITIDVFSDRALKVDTAVLEDALGLTHDVVEPNGDNRDKMDLVRERLWPLLGLTPPPAGTPSIPIPGGGYFSEADPDPES